MLSPVGPLPALVYWRRRAVVAVAALLVVFVGWMVAASGGNSRAAGTPGPAASTGPVAASVGASDSASPSGSLAAIPPAVDPGRPSAGDDASGPTGTPSAGTPSASASPTPPAPPPACSDSTLKLVVATERPAYRVGQTPVLVLTVQNVGKLTCTRDLGVAQQEALVYHGTSRLWSSNDCYPGGEKDVRALAPGEKDRFSVTWSGLTSRPTCAGSRTRVGSGSYALIARIGTLRSARAALVLR